MKMESFSLHDAAEDGNTSRLPNRLLKNSVCCHCERSEAISYLGTSASYEIATSQKRSSQRQNEVFQQPAKMPRASSNKRVARCYALIASFIFLAITLAGCGYHIAGKGGKMPGDITSVSIPIFTNSTSKPDIESTITQAFVNEFVNTVKVTSNDSVVMKGTITSYSLTPVSYTQNDVSKEYRLTVTLTLSLIQNNDKVIWEDSAISDYEDFKVNIKDISATNEGELAALKKLAQDTARFTKERMMENF